jgi:hypothetical protein
LILKKKMSQVLENEMGVCAKGVDRTSQKLKYFNVKGAQTPTNHHVCTTTV